MFNKIIKKIGIGGGIGIGGLLVGGIAFASFLITQNVSTGNSVTAASAALTVTNTAINITGLVEGGSTSPNALTIKNSGQYAGDVQLNILNTTGSLCPDLTLTITGDKTGAFSPIANGSIDLGTLAAGATINLTQVVSLKNPSSLLGQPCHWDENATISGN